MKATKVFFNGEVVTVDTNFSVCEAVAVCENRILSVGLNEDVLSFADGDTEIIDLEGRSLLPGFIDAHAHLALYGTNMLGIDGKKVQSIIELQKKLKEAANGTPSGNWIRGWGYNQNNLAEGRHLTRWDLDEVSTEHPIIVVRTCGHISCVNSKALDLMGVNNSTKNPVGGEYVKVNGELTGLLLEAAHMDAFLFANHSEQEIIEGLALASQEFLKKGITSIHEAGGFGPAHIRYLQKAVLLKEVKQRIYCLYGSLHNSPEMVGKGLESGMISGLGNEWLKIGPAKVFIDGSSSGPTAKTREPYTSNPNDSGILYLNQNELNDILGKAHELGWQITAHAIGDKAVEMMIMAIERALEFHPRINHRHRIEHSGMTPPDLIHKMKDLDIIPIPNPAFLDEFGESYLKDYGDRVDTMFPLKDFMKSEIMFAIGSDSPITTVDPLNGIHAAVNRQSKSGKPIGDRQKIAVQEAIKAYTLNGAYASFEENIKGSIESGKLADLVILNQSILQCEPHRLKELQVDMTILNGNIEASNETRGSVLYE